jgi:hypothetical protein
VLNANHCLKPTAKAAWRSRRRRDGRGPGHRPKSLSFNTSCSGGPWQPSRRAGERALCGGRYDPGSKTWREYHGTEVTAMSC